MFGPRPGRSNSLLSHRHGNIGMCASLNRSVVKGYCARGLIPRAAMHIKTSYYLTVQMWISAWVTTSPFARNVTTAPEMRLCPQSHSVGMVINHSFQQLCLCMYGRDCHFWYNLRNETHLWVSSLLSVAWSCRESYILPVGEAPCVCGEKNIHRPISM